MDPYFVLPILMGVSMYLTQRMQPEPPDPVQAAVFKYMPVIFTFLFLWFPSGLVLYWLVNNVLSILQQWFVTRQLENQARKELTMAYIKDTIAAIATPPGKGGVGIVRISGRGAVRIGKEISKRETEPRVATLVSFYDERGRTIDQGLLIYFSGSPLFHGRGFNRSCKDMEVLL